MTKPKLTREEQRGVRQMYFNPPYASEKEICDKYGISKSFLAKLTGGSTPERKKALRERDAQRKREAGEKPKRRLSRFAFLKP